MPLWRATSRYHFYILKCVYKSWRVLLHMDKVKWSLLWLQRRLHYIASGDVTLSLSCIVGNVGTKFRRSAHLFSFALEINTSEPYHFFYSMHHSLFSEPAVYIPHNATQSLSDHWRKFIRLHAASSGDTKGFMLLFFTHALALLKTS